MPSRLADLTELTELTGLTRLTELPAPQLSSGKHATMATLSQYCPSHWACVVEALQNRLQLLSGQSADYKHIVGWMLGTRILKPIVGRRWLQPRGMSC